MLRTQLIFRLQKSLSRIIFCCKICCSKTVTSGYNYTKNLFWQSSRDHQRFFPSHIKQNLNPAKSLSNLVFLYRKTIQAFLAQMPPNAVSCRVLLLQNCCRESGSSKLSIFRTHKYSSTLVTSGGVCGSEGFV